MMKLLIVHLCCKRSSPWFGGGSGLKHYVVTWKRFFAVCVHEQEKKERQYTVLTPNP